VLLVLRSLIFVVAFYIWSVFAAVIVVPLYLAPYRWMVTALRVWGMGIIFLLRVICDIKVEVRGKEFLPEGAALIAPKHQCMFDIFGSLAFIPDSCFVLKKELLNRKGGQR
jgi:1-acyl-sn-glycerol-3-phosphate acyltransferase